jgi:hypothetical protein
MSATRRPTRPQRLATLLPSRPEYIPSTPWDEITRAAVILFMTVLIIEGISQASETLWRQCVARARQQERRP